MPVEKTGRWKWLWLPALLALAWAALRFSPLPDRRLHQGYSSAALSAQGSLLRLTLSDGGLYRIHVPLDQVSPEVVRGFLGYEDRWFYLHPGINPVAVLRAAAQNLRGGRVVSGASTITMQLARMLEGRPRTWWSKAVEALRALQLEARYSKDRILEFYLNTVPMGGNLEGVGAASLLYFGKLPRDLSLAESALLVGLPRSPTRRRPDLRPDLARRGRNQVLDRILQEDGRDPLRLSRAYTAAIPSGRRPNPHQAPHAVQRLSRALANHPGIRRLTLSNPVQEIAQSELAAASAALEGIAVHNGAVVVVDNRDMSVLAYVGSPDFHSRHAGQVNGAAILRSPGSALKPFLYALAMDAGVLSPRHVVFDIPRDYGGYRPVNFQGSYTGPLPAEEALIRSLNTPAVWLESLLVSQDRGGLGSFLKRMGLNDRGRQGLEPGLSVVLGAHPVSLEELASLYAALANRGLWRPLRFFADDPAEGPSLRAFSDKASFLVLDMLSRVQRPDLPSSWEFSPIRGRVAFKTGTSFGFRDAWCVAVTPDYTVAVWLGNASAVGAAGLTAARKAAPLAFAVVNRLTRTNDAWFTPPPGVEARKVCALTGMPPGAFCPSTQEEWSIPGVSPYQPCRVHRRIWVRKKDGRRVHPDCMEGPAGAYRSKVVAVWPPDVTRFLRGFKARFEKIPPGAPDCPAVADLAPPKIVSPEPYGVYEITRALPRENQRLALSAQSSADVDRLYWFVDGYLLGESGPDQILFWDPQPGHSEIGVVDSAGRSHQVRIQVEPAK